MVHRIFEPPVICGSASKRVRDFRKKRRCFRSYPSTQRPRRSSVLNLPGSLSPSATRDLMIDALRARLGQRISVRYGDGLPAIGAWARFPRAPELTGTARAARPGSRKDVWMPRRGAKPVSARAERRRRTQNLGPLGCSPKHAGMCPRRTTTCHPILTEESVAENYLRVSGTLRRISHALFVKSCKMSDF